MSSYELPVIDLRKEKTKYNVGVLILIPSRGMVSIRWAMHLASMLRNLPTGFTWGVKFTIGKPVVQARTDLIKTAMRIKPKYVWLLDDDCCPPFDALINMIMADKDIVSGVVWSKSEPPQPQIYKSPNEPAYFKFYEEKEDVFPIDRAGLSCCLIKSKVFEKMPEPWFAMRWKKQNSEFTQTSAGEDLFFFEKAKEYGFKAYAHKEILCDHLVIQHPLHLSYPGQAPSGPKILKEIMPKEIYERAEKIRKRNIQTEEMGQWIKNYTNGKQDLKMEQLDNIKTMKK